MNTSMSDQSNPNRCENLSCGKELDGDGVMIGMITYCRDCAAELADSSLAEQAIKAFWDRHPDALFAPKVNLCANCIWPEICQLPIICGYKNLRYIERTDPEYFAKLPSLAKKLAGRLGG